MIYGGIKMYLYQITNLINGKIYIGQTNNITKRWSNHKCCNSPEMVIAQAIKKYGVDNFKFEILYKNVSIEDIDELEINTIKEKNCRVPYGYNVSDGGSAHTDIHKYGADNNNAHLTEEEAQYILDHRNIPMYVLYDEVSDKISYQQFSKLYKHKTYTNLTTNTPEYPYNFEFSCQFNGTPLEYDEVISLRQRYANGEYWRDVYKDYKDVYTNEWSFWRVYNGDSYKLVMPEVFTPENKHLHAGVAHSGANNGRAKLTSDDVIEIRQLHKDGYNNQYIYDKFPQVSSTTIRNVINGKTWKHLL